MATPLARPSSQLHNRTACPPLHVNPKALHASSYADSYSHLTDALHAWCGAHNLRDLPRPVHASTPTGRSGPGPWPTCSSTPTPPRPPPAPPARPRLTERAAGRGSPPGTAAPSPRASPTTSRSARKTAKDGLRLARRFRDNQDMILRFATDLAVGFTSNQAERDVRPVKVQQRDFRRLLAHPQRPRRLRGRPVLCHLSTAAKWSLTKLDALRLLFTTGPWLPPAIAPP